MKLGLGLGIGGSGNSLPRYVTDFTNGFELPGDTYTGGPTVVADNNGTHVTSPAGVLPIEGMRLVKNLLVGSGDLSNTAWLVSTSPACSKDGNVISFPAAMSSRVYQTVPTLPAGSKAVLTVEFSPLDTGKLIRLAVYNNGSYVFSDNLTIPISGRLFYSVDATGSGIIAVAIVNSTNAAAQSVTFIKAQLENVAGQPNQNPGEYVATTTVANGQWFEAENGNTVDENSVVIEASGDYIHASTPLRTRKGTVSVYDESYRGPLIEPARTNLFLNSTVPVTQNITTTAQQYTVTVKGTGSVTVSGTATGVATEGSPLTVTATAGTLTCTVAGTLSRVNVEAGAFGTSFITTAATTVTRPAGNWTRPTAGTALEGGNDFAIYGRVIPMAWGQGVVYPFASFVDSNNTTYTAISAGKIYTQKKISGTTFFPESGLNVPADTPFEYLAYQHSVHGMGIAVRSWDGSAWSAWSDWVTKADTQNAPIASTYQIGARANTIHFAANYPFTKIIALNPALNPQTQIADLLAKGRI